MRQKLTVAGVLILLLFLLRFPAQALFAAREGMALWLNTLLPILLPFMILTGILLHSGSLEKLLDPLSFFWKKFLGLSPWGAYVFVLGMLCGFPMGAKLSADLYAAGKISRREAEYLLTFANNPSPSFLLSYLAASCLGGKTSGREILAILFLSSMLCMLFFRFVVYKNHTTGIPTENPEKKETSHSPTGAIVDASIMNGFETITRLGGYILIFSLLSAFIRHYWPFSRVSGGLLLGITEITTGLHTLSALGLPYDWLYLFSMCATAFGGLCILAQTKSVLNRQLSLLPYVAAKCLSAVFTAGLVLLHLFLV